MNLLKLFFLIASIILFANLLPLDADKYKIGKRYIFLNQDSTFVYVEITGKNNLDKKRLDSAFNSWQIENNCSNCELYRSHQMSFLKFWKWREYLTHDRWKYPCISE